MKIGQFLDQRRGKGVGWGEIGEKRRERGKNEREGGITKLIGKNFFFKIKINKFLLK